MKKLFSATLVVAAMTASVLPSTASANNVAESLCNYVAADDKSRLRSFLKQNKLKIRTTYNGVRCNGKTLLGFAEDRNSITVGSFIVGKLPKKFVQTELASLSNPELVAAANDRVSG